MLFHQTQTNWMNLSTARSLLNSSAAANTPYNLCTTIDLRHVKWEGRGEGRLFMKFINRKSKVMETNIACTLNSTRKTLLRVRAFIAIWSNKHIAVEQDKKRHYYPLLQRNHSQLCDKNAAIYIILWRKTLFSACRVHVKIGLSKYFLYGRVQMGEAHPLDDTSWSNHVILSRRRCEKHNTSADRIFLMYYRAAALHLLWILLTPSNVLHSKAKIWFIRIYCYTQRRAANPCAHLNANTIETVIWIYVVLFVWLQWISTSFSE